MRASPDHRRRRPDRERWALAMDALLGVTTARPTEAEFAAAAAELGVTERAVRDRYAEARRIAYRRLGAVELSLLDLAAPGVADLAARLGRPAWAVRMALERTAGREPLRLLAERPGPRDSGGPQRRQKGGSRHA